MLTSPFGEQVSLRRLGSYLPIYSPTSSVQIVVAKIYTQQKDDLFQKVKSSRQRFYNLQIHVAKIYTCPEDDLLAKLKSSRHGFDNYKIHVVKICIFETNRSLTMYKSSRQRFVEN